MTRGKKEREREKRKREKEITRLFETNYGYFAGVRRRRTNGWRTPRGCILRLVNGGGRPGGGGSGSAHLRPNRSHRSVAL